MIQDLETLYASGHNKQRVLYAVKFMHSSFEGGAIRVAQSYYDWLLTEAGGDFVYGKSGIGFSYPKRDATQRVDLDMQLDDDGGDIYRLIENAMEVQRGTQEPVLAELLGYNSSDTSTILERFPMTVKSYSAQVGQVNIRASVYDAINRKWPHRRYEPQHFLNLEYV